MREAYLRTLAGETGLTYAPLEGSARLGAALKGAATPRPVPGRFDPRPILGASALLLLLATFLAPLLRARVIPTWKKA